MVDDSSTVLKTKRALSEKQCLSCEVRFETFVGHKREQFFCSRSCSNRFRTHSIETKLKISNSLTNPFRQLSFCLECRTLFTKSKTRFCSSLCKTSYKEKQLIREKEYLSVFFSCFSEFDVPQKREFGYESHLSEKIYGSWGKALKINLLKPNPLKFQRIRCVASDGHILDSLSERIIDNFLSENLISHEVHKRIGTTKFFTDFFLVEREVYVEYYGLIGQNSTYDETVNFKREIYKDLGLRVIEIFPSDLYPINKLALVFGI